MMQKEMGTMPLATRSFLFKQLAIMEKAGIPVLDALQNLRLPAPYQNRLVLMRRWLRRMPLAEAGEQSGILTTLEASLLKTAMSAGSPLAIYQRLAKRYGVRAEQIRKMKLQLILPAMIIVVLLLVQPLPALVGGELTHVQYLLVVMQPLLVVGLVAWLVVSFPELMRRSAHSSTRYALESLALRLPVAGPLLKRVACRDFLENLGLLLEAGVPAWEALPLAQKTVGIMPIRASFDDVLQALKSGQPMSTALGQSRYLQDDALYAFVLTGEQSGELPAMIIHYTDREAKSIALRQSFVLTWVPRLIYIACAVWIGWSILNSNAFMPTASQVEVLSPVRR